MAKNKIGLQFEGWEETITKLNSLAGDRGTMKAVEEALTESKEYVNELIDNAVNSGSLPAKGRYSSGNTKESINRDSNVEWQGQTATIKVGFDFKKSGTTSIFLMYGTPKMKPAKGLKNAIYGSKSKKEVAEIQAEIINKHIKKVMEG
jgi:hypothetical protein